MAGDEDREPVEHTTADDADDSKAAEEEDTGAEIAPIVKLDAVAVSTGEENEDATIDLKAKLYRFDKDGNQWKERGVGQVRLLKHKETGRIRLVMRQNKTLKICANHSVLPTINMQEHQGNDKTCVWHATDFADGELKDELFCIKFANVENTQAFKTAFEDAQKAMAEIISAAAATPEKDDAEAVGEKLGSLNVNDGAEGKDDNKDEKSDESKEAKDA